MGSCKLQLELLTSAFVKSIVALCYQLWVWRKIKPLPTSTIVIFLNIGFQSAESRKEQGFHATKMPAVDVVWG